MKVKYQFGKKIHRSKKDKFKVLTFHKIVMLATVTYVHTKTRG